MARAPIRIAAVILPVLLCALTPTSAAAGVVVSASGPSATSYPVGRKIADDERIVLRAGDTLTVLDGNGTRVLRGAGTHSIGGAAGAGNKRNTFAVLTERRSAQRVRTGAVRAGDGDTPVHAPNLWYIDVDRPGTMCLAETDRVRLWRRNSDGEATYVVSAPEGGKSHTVEFAAGEVLAPWDTGALPLTAGPAYRIASAGAAGSSEVSFVVLTEVAREPQALAEQLIANGCMAQLDVLASATMLADG